MPFNWQQDISVGATIDSADIIEIRQNVDTVDNKKCKTHYSSDKSGHYYNYDSGYWGPWNSTYDATIKSGNYSTVNSTYNSGVCSTHYSTHQSSHNSTFNTDYYSILA